MYTNSFFPDMYSLKGLNKEDLHHYEAADTSRPTNLIFNDEMTYFSEYGEIVTLNGMVLTADELTQTTHLADIDFTNKVVEDIKDVPSKSLASIIKYALLGFSVWFLFKMYTTYNEHYFDK